LAKAFTRPVASVVSRPEFAPLVLLVVAAFLAPRVSDYFDAGFLLRASPEFMEIGLMSLGMTLVIVAGQIDLSVASTLALVACVSGKLMEVGWSVPAASVAGVALGGLLGALNGVLVAKMRLPSFVVTLATMALFRGAAQVITASQTIKLPAAMYGLNYLKVPGTSLPVPLLIYAVLAVVLGLILHRTVLGRWIYTVGTNEAAAHYSGVPTARVKVSVFAIAGALAGLAGLMMNSRITVGRFDHARGYELDVITAVLLGGTSIYGGRGTMLGSVIALALIGLVRKGMGVANVTAEYQLTIIGFLLVLAVVLGNLSARLSNRRSL
jgi:rhamnose transport system permease protein